MHKALAEAVPQGKQPFSIITGVSVGALSASVLATHGDNFHRGVENLVRVWQNLHCDQVFHADRGSVASQLLRWARAFTLGWAGASPPKSILDNSPLGELVLEHVDFDRLNELVGQPGALKAFAITASSYETGHAVTFYRSGRDIIPWTRARRVGRRCRLSARHVLASSALPLVFPAISLDGAYYGDGALREHAPLSAAIHLGCDNIVTIGARDGKPDMPAETPDTPYPSVGDLGGQMLDILFNDNMDADIERLTRINDTITQLDEGEQERARLRPIKITSITPSQDIRRIAGEHADELPGPVKTVLNALGAMKPPFVLPSYLTFEPGYINALIELGYRDANKRMDALLKTTFNGA
ncbi:MAG: patatin-like phospholipase family protein [Pseudomonadota bacterium]